jgi:HJR/Mrr/RecB family endonuclease
MRNRSRGFLAVLVDDVFGATRPMQRYEHVLDVTEVVLRESIDVVGRVFRHGKVLIELRTVNPFFGYAVFTKGTVDERHQVALAQQGDSLQPARPRAPPRI